MKLLQDVKILPTNLRFVFFLLVSAPLWALWVVDSPFHLYQLHAPQFAILVAATYWCLPLILATLLVQRSFYFLPCLILECTGLLTHALTVGHLPASWQGIRFAAIGFTVILGMLFSSRDALFPFFSEKRRGWRRKPRLKSAFEVRLASGSAQVVDLSLTGMQVTTSQENIKSFDNIKITTAKSTLDARVVWVDKENSQVILGLEIDDLPAMRDLIFSLPNRGNLPPLARLLSTPALRGSLFGLWVVALGAALALPACKEEASEFVLDLRPRSIAASSTAVADPKLESFMIFRSSDVSTIISTPATTDVIAYYNSAGEPKTVTGASQDTVTIELKTGEVPYAVIAEGNCNLIGILKRDQIPDTSVFPPCKVVPYLKSDGETYGFDAVYDYPDIAEVTQCTSCVGENCGEEEDPSGG